MDRIYSIKGSNTIILYPDFRVSQCSVLGPLLFFIYISYIKRLPNKYNIPNISTPTIHN